MTFPAVAIYIYEVYLMLLVVALNRSDQELEAAASGHWKPRRGGCGRGGPFDH